MIAKKHAESMGEFEITKLLTFCLTFLLHLRPQQGTEMSFHIPSPFSTTFLFSSISAPIKTQYLLRPMSKEGRRRGVRWSWTSAFVGAAAAAATVMALSSKPRDPDFHLISIDLTSFKLNFPVVDAELILTVHVTNPNVTSINYSSTEMSIFYSGDHLGSARVKAGSQPPRSCQVLRLPARLSGLQLAHHGKEFVADVAKREMLLDATVDIEGFAKVMWWDHKFRVHVDSHVTVDPVFLDVIDQENKSALEVFVK